MISTLVRLVEHAHGHLGWLAAAALAHPAIALARARRTARLSASLGTALVTATAATGLGLYGTWHAELRQTVFVRAPALGWAFERKEHLAVGAVLLAWTGLFAHIGEAGGSGGDQGRALRAAARAAYAAAAAMAIVAAALGVRVAAFAPF